MFRREKTNIRLVFASSSSGVVRSVDYSCNIGDWQLPDYWQHDHRVSDCGHYIALLPYTEVPDGCGLVVFADIRARRLISIPSLMVMAGRLDSSLKGSPLLSVNNRPLLAQQAAKLCRDHKDISLFYRVCHLRLCCDQLLLVPN